MRSCAFFSLIFLVAGVLVPDRAAADGISVCLTKHLSDPASVQRFVNPVISIWENAFLTGRNYLNHEEVRDVLSWTQHELMTRPSSWSGLNERTLRFLDALRKKNIELLDHERVDYKEYLNFLSYWTRAMSIPYGGSIKYSISRESFFLTYINPELSYEEGFNEDFNGLRDFPMGQFFMAATRQEVPESGKLIDALDLQEFNDLSPYPIGPLGLVSQAKPYDPLPWQTQKQAVGSPMDFWRHDIGHAIAKMLAFHRLGGRDLSNFVQSNVLFYNRFTNAYHIASPRQQSVLKAIWFDHTHERTLKRFTLTEVQTIYSDLQRHFQNGYPEEGISGAEVVEAHEFLFRVLEKDSSLGSPQ